LDSTGVELSTSCLLGRNSHHPLYLYITFSLTIQLWLTFRFFSIPWLLWIMLQWVWGFRYLFKIVFSVLLGIYWEVGLLGHMVDHIFHRGSTILQSYQQFVRFLFYSCILTNTFFCFCFSIMAISVGVRWYLIVVLVSFPWC
jgi:hypothetical protein